MYKFGWQPDLPDIRDYGIAKSKGMLGLLKKSEVYPYGDYTPEKTGLREWFSPVETQGNLGSCCSQAGVALLEYFENRAMGHHIDASRLFLYKTTRNLLNWVGDTGAYIRSTMGAMAMFGVPPEKYWPYTDNGSKFDKEPTSFVYSLAQRWRPTVYFRMDLPGVSKDVLLNNIKAFLRCGWPMMFGFTVYDSIKYAKTTGEIPYPSEKDEVEGGHALTSVGFDDAKVIVHLGSGESTKGALLIRNSWGSEWGDQGYGWISYKYVLSGLAIDWWTILSADYIDSGKFGV